MKIHELYEREISRRINPAVVVSEMDKESIRQEIDEYIFTTDITQNIYKFLKAVANKKAGKTGVWISGYYGSGKSHFIKYLFYCLNQQYRDSAFSNFKEAVRTLDPFEEPNIQGVTLLENNLKSLTIEEIIFNIDAVSDNKGSKDRITRVLLNQLNAHRGYNNSNIALALYLEKHLDRLGKFEDFKNEIYNRFGEKWEGNSIIRFVHSFLSNVIEVAYEFDNNLDKDTLKKSIQNKEQDYSIEFLIDELSDYVKGKDDNFRLLFLIDEVSQYIGSDTTLLLNLQTIVEEIGSKIGTKVWVVCTAQQDLSNLIDNADSKTEDFGKIMGRFETMISLQSQDAAYITKRRVLEKNSEGTGALNSYYADNKGAITNQFVFEHDHYENFKGRDDFALTYPFVPYQFRLISDVFESFSNVGYVGEGVKNTERAILGITHYTAGLCKDDEVGYFVPFDLFFNEQFNGNLTHRANGILSRAHNIKEIKEDDFAKRVVKVLFMISNLGESQSVNFAANVQNLALLLMDSVDTPKLEMQRKVQKVLDVLQDKNIVQASEGKYRFYKEDEVEVAHSIRKTPVTNEDRYTYIYEDILKKAIKPDRTINFGNKSFRMALKVDDKEYFPNGDFETRFTFLEDGNIDNMALSTSKEKLVVCIGEWFYHDKEFRPKLDEYVKTQVYIRENLTNASGARVETLKNFRENNERLMSEMKLRFDKKFLETNIISNQQVVRADELNGASPATRFDDMVRRHLEALYSKHHLSNGYATSNSELHATSNSAQKTIDLSLTPAEQELDNYLAMMGDNIVVGDVVKKFEKAPYGWRDISTLDIFVRLAKKGLRRFEWRNEEIDVKVFAQQALNSRERDAIMVSKAKVYSQEETANFIGMVNNDIFAERLIPSGTTDFKEAVEIFKEQLKVKLTTISKEKEEYEAYPFATHIKTFYKYLDEIAQTRNPEEVVKRVGDLKDVLKTARDKYKDAQEFTQNNFDTYRTIRTFVENNKDNFKELDEIDTPRTQELTDYIKRDNEPWDKYPQMRKLYQELSKAVKNRLETLRNSVAQEYEEIFEEIDKRKEELEVDAHITPEKEYNLQKINTATSIAQLKINKLEATKFKADNLKKIIDHKAEEVAKKKGEAFTKSLDVSVAAEMKPTTITNEQELDQYLKKLKEQLMLKLQQNKKLWLN